MKKKFQIITTFFLTVICLLAHVSPVNANSSVTVKDIPTTTLPDSIAVKISTWVNANIPNLDQQHYTLVYNGKDIILFFKENDKPSVSYNYLDNRKFEATPHGVSYWFDINGEFKFKWTDTTIELARGKFYLLASNGWFFEYFYQFGPGGTQTTYRSRINMRLKGINDSVGSAIENSNEKTQEAIKDVENTIKDDSVDTSAGGGFFEGFESDSYGLTSIITSPLQMIKSIANQGCSPISAPLPYVDQSLTLPCMTPIYTQNFGGFFTMYQIIMQGFISYKIAIDIFAMVKGMKDPESDKVEVLDL